MTLNISDLKNKIIYRSSYRGNKEMDILLKSFVLNVIDTLNTDELQNLLNLLNIDDDTLYKYKNGIETEIKLSENRISRLFKNYNYKK